MAILITGCAGFIGSNLVDFYLQRGEEVIGIDNLSTGQLANIQAHLQNKRFTFYQSNLLDWKEMESVVSYCEVIFHLAAMVGMFNILEKPIATLEVNMGTTESLLTAISKLQRKPVILLASSSEVYGSKREPMRETDPLIIECSYKIHASYPISKLCNEVAGMAYFQEMQVPVVVMRLFNTVGRRQSSRYGMVLPRFIKQAMSNEPITIFGDGTQTRAFCDIRDTCNILYALSTSTQSVGEIINVGSEQSTTILELAELVKALTHSKSTFHFETLHDSYGDGYINTQHRKPDLSKLQSIIPYRHQWSLEATIKDMIEASSAL
jgi:UDP-glucose 4-epimerase